MVPVTVIPVVLILSISQPKILCSASLASGQQEVVDALGLHNVLWVTKHKSRVLLSWNNNLTKEETERYTVKYVLSYKFFNTTQERKERLQEKEKIIPLGLHSGFNAKVKTQLFRKETEDIIKESGWTELTYKASPVYIQNLSCIIYNISFFNCTWHIKAEAPADIQILFSYRHAGKDFECQQYTKNARKKNVGCHMKEVYFQPSRKINLNISVRGLRNNSIGLSYHRAFTPQTIEKLNPPINVSASLENRSIKIHWKPPPTIGSARKKCFLYQVKITDRKIEDVTAEKYEYPFHNPGKACAAQVRVKKETCIRNKIWSEWSEPVFIHGEKRVDVMLLTLTLFCLLIFLGGFLICACRRHRCLEVITMPVPHPSDDIKSWLAADGIHPQKQMSAQMEMHSEVTMGIPWEDNRDENVQQQKCLKQRDLEGLCQPDVNPSGEVSGDSGAESGFASDSSRDVSSSVLSADGNACNQHTRFSLGGSNTVSVGRRGSSSYQPWSRHGFSRKKELGRITTSVKNDYRRHLENKCHDLTDSFLREDIELIYWNSQNTCELRGVETYHTLVRHICVPDFMY